MRMEQQQAIYLLARLLTDKTDSVAKDLAFQYRLFKQWGFHVRVFAGRYNQEYYPDLPIEDSQLLPSALQEKSGHVIYHACQGWKEMDDYFRAATPSLIIKWHNVTPPWFFAPYSLNWMTDMLRGYQSVLQTSRELSAKFWVDSNFSKRQLEILGIDPARIQVVYPVSHYMEKEVKATQNILPTDSVTLLFVGRIVPNKGYKHVLAAAAVLQRLMHAKVTVCLPGRFFDDMASYIAELKSLAVELNVAIDLPGEVTPEQLNDYYSKANAFICLSEHEGFGLPVIEAMKMGLPVVGYRVAAVAETLADHPLACDRLDYYDIAKKLAVAIQPDPVRSAIIDFQSQEILPRFSRTTIEAQIKHALSEEIAQPANQPLNNKNLQLIEKALDLQQQTSRPIEYDSLQFCQEYPNRYVTHYDLRALNSLLCYITKDVHYLRSQAKEIKFNNSVSFMGKVINFIKKVILHLNEGVIATLAMAQTQTDQRLVELDEKISYILRQIELEQTGNDFNHKKDS